MHGAIFRGLLAGLVAFNIPVAAFASALTEIRDFGPNPGQLRMFVLVPPELPRNAPLVVLAHGCFQSAQEIADMSGWPGLAVAHRFAIALPQTSRENEPMAGCFRTWQPEHLQRGAGEPLSVAQMVEWMIAHHALDRKRVFITGLSSGGLLTNVMLATYPDVFAAGAPQSAYPYKCATSFADITPCCLGKITHTPEVWAALARSGYPDFRGTRPRVSIWHGSADPLLVVMGQTFQMQQWAGVLGVDGLPDDVAREGSASRYLYRDRAGRAQVETVTIAGMGHAVAVDPGARPVACGEVRAFSADVGVCAAAWIADWFGILD